MTKSVRARAAALFMSLFLCSAVDAQEITLFAEPLAGGAQFLAKPSQALGIGVAATAGPLFGAELSDAKLTDARNWATAYATVSIRSPGVQMVLNPIGVALVRGNDFSAVYPSAQAGAELLRGRLRAGTALRVIRVAGANGSGTYWTQWVPLRVGYVLKCSEVLKFSKC